VAFWRRAGDTGKRESAIQGNAGQRGGVQRGVMERSVVVARDAYQVGTLDAAQYEDHLRQVIATGDPRSAGFAAAHLAILLGDRGRPVEAEQWYREAVHGGCEEVKAPAATNLAVLLIDRGRLAEAEALLRHVMSLSDAHAAAMAAHNLGGLLADQGRTMEALTVLRVAVDSGHPDESVGAMLLVGRIRLRQRQPDGARHAFEQVVASRHPQYARQAYQLLAELGRAY
jgi:Flp pilus assembly protein TadD